MKGWRAGGAADRRGGEEFEASALSLTTTAFSFLPVRASGCLKAGLPAGGGGGGDPLWATWP